MAIFKANYVKRGKTAKALAKASVRYIQHRRGKDGATITRTLFNTDGPMARQDAYRMIDDAQKGSFFYRFVLSPDPTREDHHHDLDMRDIAYQTMLALEERVGASISWVGAIHADHTPHLHAHLIAIVPHKLDVLDFALLRARTTAAALEQRHVLDLMRTRQRERPYPVPTVAATRRRAAPLAPHRRTWGTPGLTGLKYPSLGTSSSARREARRRRAHAFWQRPRARIVPRLSLCTCPRCQQVHVHHTRDPVHRCDACGLLLHRPKRLILTPTRKGAGWAL